jgi:hypothetical protein
LKLLPPLLAWLIALATLAGAAHELRHERNLADITNALTEMPGLNAKPSPLNLVDYQAIQKKTAVFGTVSLTASPDGLSIKANTLSDYAAWRLTVDQVLLSNPGINWRIDYLCSGKCPSGEAHKATLLGSRIAAAN